MGEINSAQYSSVFPRFLLSLGFHPLGEDAKSCESPWLLVETAFFTPLSVDLGLTMTARDRSPLTSLLAPTTAAPGGRVGRRIFGARQPNQVRDVVGCGVKACQRRSNNQVAIKCAQTGVRLPAHC